MPETHVLITEEAIAQQVTKLCDALEECDDILEVHANFDLSPELCEQLA
jgi:transcriptional/translational regulatory protein YebC/TACO1